VPARRRAFQLTLVLARGTGQKGAPEPEGEEGSGRDAEAPPPPVSLPGSAILRQADVSLYRRKTSRQENDGELWETRVQQIDPT
jgi:hypothetical protein